MTTSSATAQGGNPLAGVRLFVDHDSPSWQQWRAYRRTGQRHKAARYAPRALSYARFATRWESPPRGTFRGFRVG